jgi:hypothetical protein
MDTSGFYKQTEEGWIYAPNAVHAPEYTLERNGNRESVDGWEWHEKAPAEYIVWEYEQNNINDNGNTI